MEFMKKVEEISKKVGDTATNTYNTVADKSGKLIEETKLRIAISDKETDIDEIYEEMGKAVYNAYKSIWRQVLWALLETYIKKPALFRLS